MFYTNIFCGYNGATLYVAVVYIYVILTFNILLVIKNKWFLIWDKIELLLHQKTNRGIHYVSPFALRTSDASFVTNDMWKCAALWLHYAR